MLHTVLVVFALVCEVLAAFNIPATSPVNLIALGLAFFFASLVPF